MSVRKPLVRFDTQSRAKLVSVEPSLPLALSSSRRKKKSDHSEDLSMPRRKRSSGGGKRRSSGKGKPRVVKGRVNVRVAGYLGVQKLAPSKLIPYLPATKVRQAAKKALVASGSKPSRGKRTVRRKGRKGRKKRRRRTRRKTRTRRKR